MLVTETDLGTPSITMFRTQLAGSGGVEAGAVYDSGARTYLRITDLDNSGNAFPTVTAVVTAGASSYTVTLTQIGTSGIFEADLGDRNVFVSNTAGQTADQAAAYFSALPNGTSLTASYTDSNDSSDVSGDAIVVNTPPTAVNNNRSIGVDKQAIGNVITDDDNGAASGGVDTDPNGNQLLQVTAVNGSAVNLNDTITLASGARLLVKSDGSYIYDPSSLTLQPTSGSPRADSFTYTISDGQGGTSTATVNITVTYVNPIVIDNQISTDGQLVEFDVSNKFSDIVADVVFSSSALPAGLSIDSATGIITGVIDKGASTGDGTNDGIRAYTVTITATELDANGVATTTTYPRSFTWTINNVAPIAANDIASTREGVAVTGNVLANDADGSPDSDALSVTQFTVGGTTYTAGTTARTLSGVGTIVLNTSGAYTFTPDAGFHGGAVPQITYTISDGNSGSSTAVLSLSVIGVSDIAVNEGSPWAVFEVSGVANENVTLALINGTASMDVNGVPILDGSEDFGPTLECSTDSGTSWGTYSSGAVALNGSGKLLVRTLIINDTLYEGAHTFFLRAFNSLNSFDDGTATIQDDGTGQWSDGSSGTGSSTPDRKSVV